MIHWWACEFPERPGDGCQLWHYDDCVGCQVKMQATIWQLKADPDPTARQAQAQAEHVLSRMLTGSW